MPSIKEAIKPLSYTFVGVWTNPLLAFPVPDQKFALDLFGDPYNSNVGFNQDGYVIIGPPYKSNRPPLPMLQLSQLRIQVTTQSIEQTADVVSHVKRYLTKRAEEDSQKGVSLNVRAVGFNSDFEWSSVAPDISEWLGNRFIRHGIGIESSWSVQATKLSFSVKESSKNVEYQITLEPRVKCPDSLYILFDNHKEMKDQPIPDNEELHKQMSESCSEAIDTIVKLFQGGSDA